MAKIFSDRGGPAAGNKNEWEGSPESVPYAPDARVFVTLVGVSAAGIAAFGFLFWYIPSVGLRSIHPALPYVTGAALLGLVLFVLAGGVAIAISAARGRDFVPSPRYRGLLVKFFLPLMVLVGGLLRIPRIRIESAFIEINNRMVKALVRGRLSPEKILILMPHCIQYDDCRIKVTRDVSNCVGCGRCEIKDLVGLSKEYNLKLFVLTGGTVARMRLKELRPDAVIAVACERDLTSGVQDAFPLPVMAIVNKRPNGYCFQTGVDVGEVRNAIREFLGDAAAA